MAKSREDYKKELVDVLSQLSEDGNINKSDYADNFYNIPIVEDFEDAQDPYVDYDLDHSLDINAISRQLADD